MAQPDQIDHSLVKALKGIPEFAALDDHARLEIVGASAILFWPAGSLIFEKGSAAEALYIVLSGRVRIYEPGAEGEGQKAKEEDGDVEVAEMGPGDFFGELALLLEGVRSKSARALEDVELMVIPKTSFDELLAGDPDLNTQVRRKFDERLPAR